MSTPLASKLGLKSGARGLLVNAPGGVAEQLGCSGATFARSLAGSFTYLHAVFTESRELVARFDTLKHHLAEGGALWVSWPKAGQLETDLSLKKVIEIGYDHGLVESKTIGIDATWSAIKFTWPKSGKVYRNSHGTLR